MSHRLATMAMVIALMAKLGHGQTVAQNDVAATDNRGENRLVQADDLFRKATAWETAGDPEQAALYYEQVRELFPKNPVVLYRLGRIHQQLGQKEEAIKLLREFLRIEYTGPETADGHSRLQELLLPTLTDSQRDLWELAADHLQVASELQSPVDPDESDSSPPQASLRAIELLTTIKTEVPEYLPIYSRLGTVYQQTGELTKACEAYTKYLDGFEKLEFEPQDFREIRRRKIVCEELLALRQQETLVLQQQKNDKQQVEQEELQRRAAAQALEARREELRQILATRGSIVKTSKIFRTQTQTIAFENGVMVATWQTAGEPDVDFVGLFKMIVKVTPGDLDPESVRFEALSQPAYETGAFNIHVTPKTGRLYWIDDWMKRSRDGPLTHSTYPSNGRWTFSAPDANTAETLVKALRELIVLSSDDGNTMANAQ